MQNIIFWTFATIAIIAALYVIAAKNPVRAVLSLIITFCATAVTWLAMDAEFLGITLVLVYVGAVMVLFLFVVMMLDVDFTTLTAKFTKLLPIGLALALGLFISLAAVLYKVVPAVTDPALLSYGEKASNTQLLGTLVFTKYLLQFEVAGVLLLVAIIAAIGLIYRGPHARKVQRIDQQVRVKAQDRLRLVDGN